MTDRHTILLVEDNERILWANQEMLLLHGYRVLSATSVQQARERIQQGAPDLIVLDILLPDGSGLDLCQSLRGKSDIPILFLSALGQKNDIVRGLRSGGDDYLSKPYDYEELLARIEALLRRSTNAMAKQLIEWHALVVDTLSGRAYVNGQDIMLKPREYALLRALWERRSTYTTPEALYSLAWGGQPGNDMRTVRTHIYHLRQKLKEDERLSIVYERGEGYRMLYQSSKEHKP